MKKIVFLFLTALLFWQCTEQPASSVGKKPHIVCTTSMAADAVRQIVPQGVVVTALMGPGVDPHLYKATQGDLERLQQADVIVYNGLHLEGKMGEVLEKLQRIKKVICLTDDLSAKHLILMHSNVPDPHIWFDLSLWTKAVLHLKTELGGVFPSWKDDLDANYFEFEQNMLATHNNALNLLSTIPQEQRVLITAHDAFSYFGKAYGLEVRALQGISTASEFGLKDVSDLVHFIVEKQIKAVFVESSVPKKSIEAVVAGCKDRGHNVVLGGQLYSDALGEANSPEATLEGAFKANVQTIYKGLMHGSEQTENPN